MEKLYCFIKPSPSLFELTYMPLQNSCKNNGVTNDLKERTKACKQLLQTFYMFKLKRRKRDGDVKG